MIYLCSQKHDEENEKASYGIGEYIWTHITIKRTYIQRRKKLYKSVKEDISPVEKWANVLTGRSQTRKCSY